MKTTTATTIHQRLWDDGKLKVTVLRDDVEPGSGAQIDYGFPGQWFNPTTGKRHRIWALVMVLPASRHMFVRPVEAAFRAVTKRRWALV